jgi:hypothetical protein
MAVCASAVETANGYVVVLDTAQTNVGTCQYVLQTGSEFSNGSLAILTPDEAVSIAWRVAALWAVAWGIKQVARLLLENDNVQNES